MNLTSLLPGTPLSARFCISHRLIDSTKNIAVAIHSNRSATEQRAPIRSLLLNTIRATNVPRDLVTGNNNTQVTRDYCPTLVITSQISHLRCKQSDINIAPVWMLPTCGSDDLRSAGLSHSLDSARDVVIWKQIYFLPSKT